MIIDSRIGGLGDIWMRLLALYTMSRLTNQRHTVLIRPVLLPMAQSLFGKRIDIDHQGQGNVIYTHLGLRHLLGGMATGKRYVLPFHWVLRRARPKTTLKHRLNDALILGASRTGLVRLTNPGRVYDYEGYVEIAALAPFGKIGYEEFCLAAIEDLQELQDRLHRLGSGFTPRSADTVVYPSGSAHQNMPVTWAKKHLPDAIFAFHSEDADALVFEKAGLTVERFATQEEHLQSGFGARRIICTDSFSGHFWQVYTNRVVLLQTEQIKSYIVHPGFPRSQVIESRAPCCPCLHLARGPENKPCMKGFTSCVTWDNPEYIRAFEEAFARLG